MEKIKHFSIAAFFILFVLFGNSQINKGNFLAGGSLSLSSQKYSGDDNSITAITVAPSGGYFFIDNAAAGLKVSFSSYKNDGDKFKDIIAGPFARYYFLPAEKKTNIFLEGSFLLGSEKYSGFNAESKTQLGFAVGLAFFLNKSIALETAFAWQTTKYTDDAGRYNKLGLFIGLQCYFQGSNTQKVKK